MDILISIVHHKLKILNFCRICIISFHGCLFLCHLPLLLILLVHFLVCLLSDLLPPIGLSVVPDEDLVREVGEVDAKLRRGEAGGGRSRRGRARVWAATVGANGEEENQCEKEANQ